MGARKKKRRLLSLTVAVLMIFTFMPATTFAAPGGPYGEGENPINGYFGIDKETEGVLPTPSTLDDGQVWVGKTVSKVNELDNGLFQITLSVKSNTWTKQEENQPDEPNQPPLVDGTKVTIKDTIGDMFSPADLSELTNLGLSYDSANNEVAWELTAEQVNAAATDAISVSFDVALKAGWVVDTWYETNKTAAKVNNIFFNFILCKFRFKNRLINI